MPADEHTLYIATQLDAREVLSLACQDLGLPDKIRQRPSPNLIYTQPSYVTVVPVHDPASGEDRRIRVETVERLSEQYTDLPDLFRMIGIRTQPPRHVEVDFQILSSDYFGASYLEIIRVVSAILRKVIGDCYWGSTGAFIPRLIRKNGQVIIDPTLGGWKESALQALSVPFVIDKLPFDPDR